MVLPESGLEEQLSPTQSSSLRVLLALPRPLLTLLDKDGKAWVSAAEWDPVAGQSQVSPLQRSWSSEAIESALQVSGAPLVVRVLYHPTEASLRLALSEGYDVLIADAHDAGDGSLYFEGPYGESHPISPNELGALAVGGGLRLAILLACSSAVACEVLHKAGVPSVVSVAKKTREDAVRAYLDTFFGHTADGESLEGAHEKGCDFLCRRWGTRLTMDELPRLVALPSACQSHLLVPDAEGPYVRLHQLPAEACPPMLAVRLRGRAADQVLVQRLLLSGVAQGISPLVTLHAPDGMGKSALALAVAHWFWERAIFSGGVHFVRLAERSGSEQPDWHTTQAGDLAGEILRCLGASVPEVDEADTDGAIYQARVAALCAALEGKPRLLVLDNFESACDAVGSERNLALLQDLRQRCPGLHILVTSRRASLGLPTERPYELKPLAEEAAVELFRDRALDAGKMMLHAERTIVSEICGLLDRVPLHIRLVASHMRAGGPPTAILEGLRDGEQQRRLCDVLDSRDLAFRYTFDRLSRDGRRLWAIMAGLFAGEPGRTAVRDVYGEGADPALDQLLMWSVVESVRGRHHMSEVLREFGRARLAEGALDGDTAMFRERHAAYHLAYAQRYRDDYEMLERELPEILVGFALAAAPKTRNDERVRDYAQAMGHFYYARQFWPELETWSQECINACEQLGDQAGLARAYNDIGLLCMTRGEHETALAWYEKGISVLEALDDLAGLSTAYNNLGLISETCGASNAALTWYGKNAKVKEALQDWAGLVKTYNRIGVIHRGRGEYDAALASFETSLSLCKRLGLDQYVADVQDALAQVYRQMGRK